MVTPNILLACLLIIVAMLIICRLAYNSAYSQQVIVIQDTEVYPSDKKRAKLAQINKGPLPPSLEFDRREYKFNKSRSLTSLGAMGYEPPPQYPAEYKELKAKSIHKSYGNKLTKQPMYDLFYMRRRPPNSRTANDYRTDVLAVWPYSVYPGGPLDIMNGFFGPRAELRV